MYAFKEPTPYAYLLILVIPPKLIPIYLFRNCYLLKRKKSFLVTVNGAFKIHVKSKIDNESAFSGVKRLQS